MAPRLANGTNNRSGNELAQRLGGGGANKGALPKPIKGTLKPRTRNNNGLKDSNNPLMARLENTLQTRSKTRSQNSKPSNGNSLAQRIRSTNNTRSQSIPRDSSLNDRLNFVPAELSKQTETLRTQRLRSSSRSLPSSKVTKSGPPLIRNKTIIKIKNASNPNFFKIKNLEYGTTTSDLKVVLESIGKTKNIKIKDLESGSSVAEVVFISESALDKAHRQLNGAIADGRTLKTEITNDSEISNTSAHSVSEFSNGPRGPRAYNSRRYN